MTTLLALALLSPVLAAFAGIRILEEFERGVVRRGDRILGVLEPGIRWIVPVLDRIVRVSVRPIVLDTPEQELRSRDAVTLPVVGRIEFQVSDPTQAVLQGNYLEETWKAIQQELADGIASTPAADTTKDPAPLEQRILDRLNAKTSHFGIRVDAVRLSFTLETEGR